MSAAGPLLLWLAALGQPAPVAPPPSAPHASQVAVPPAALPHMQEAPGARWACDPEHERLRQADLEIARADLPKGPRNAVADLPRLQAALAHAPDEPLGGFVVCDGHTYAFDPPAGLALLLGAASRHEPLTVDRRPMPYAALALLVGSAQNELGRADLALQALDRGLRLEPDNLSLAGEKAFALIHVGRSGEAADLCARVIADTTPRVRGGDDAVLLARLHRMRAYALGELGRYDDAIAEYHASQAIDPAETASANEIAYLEGRKAGRGPSPERILTTDKARKPPG